MSVHSVQLLRFVKNEIPTGFINNVNKNFTLNFIPLIDSVEVFLNGNIQTPGLGSDYTILSDVITFDKAPRPNSKLLVSYFR